MGRKIRSFQIGERFGRLTIIADGGRNDRSQKQYLAKCECGSEGRAYIASKLLSGHTQSCGCLLGYVSAKRLTKHGRARTTEFQSWVHMKQRCENPNDSKYPLYGAVGITVCERWRNDFSAFLFDVGPKPSPKHSIDRYPNNNGNYEPGNVRWATPLEQAQNLRTNSLVQLRGETICFTEAARVLNISRSTLKNYIARNGMTHQQIIDRFVEQR